MNKYDIGKLCLRCMKISDEPDICPFCGHEKIGEKTWAKALTPGTILNNKILIGNILGKGGYGITYIGFDLLLEYRVAIKEFFPEDLVDRAEDGRNPGIPARSKNPCRIFQKSRRGFHQRPVL